MNTAEFLEAIKLNITQPSYQQLFTPSNVLSLAKQEQEARVVPAVRSLNEEFFVKKKLEPILAGQENIQIPRRAAGRALRAVQYQPDGAQNPYNLPRVTMQATAQMVAIQQANPTAVYLMGDKVHFWPVPVANGTFVEFFEQMPSRPVLTTETGTIINVGVDTVTLSKTPPVNIIVGALIDITQNYPGYQLVYEDIAITNITGNTIQLAGFTALAPITGVSVGDSLSLATTTSIFQLFDEAVDLLVQATSSRILKAMQQSEMAKGIDEQFEKKLLALKQITTPRIEGSIPKVIQRNNLLRSGIVAGNWPAVSI